MSAPTLTIKKRKHRLADFVVLKITYDQASYRPSEWVFDAAKTLKAAK